MIQSEYVMLLNDFDTVVYPTKTYGVDFVNKCVKGHITGIEAMEQAIYKILLTERFKHIIYSWNYGIELVELMGKLYPYIYSVLQQRITEALMADDRIMQVYNFIFKPDKGKHSLLVTFDVDTTEGKLSIEKEVVI